MPKDISKDFNAYNLPHIIRVAVEFYGKDGDVSVSTEQLDMLKESYPAKKVPLEVKYKEIKQAKEPK